MLDGVLEKFLQEVNEHLEPIRDEILNMDRLSFYFLIVGSIGTTIVGALLASLVSIYALIVMALLFIFVQACVYYRNYRQQQFLQQSMVLNLAILIYLGNQNVFYRRGVQVQMGYVG